MKTARLIFVFSLMLPLSLLTAVEVPSGPRAALLIGNEKYEGFALKGVSQSLDRVEAALKKEGYSIVRMQDLNSDGQKKEVIGGLMRARDLELWGEVFLTGLIVFLNAFGLQNFVIDGKFVQPSLPGAIELVVVSEEKVT